MFGIMACWNNGLKMEMFFKITTFQYSIIPLFLLYVTLKPVKTIIIIIKS